MSTPEMLTMNCPNDETLALFVEGKLQGDARTAVIEHLTECADCRDIVLMATEEAAANNVVPGKFERPKWLPYLAAAAAVLVLMFGVPAVWRSMQRDDLRELNSKFEKRQVEARLSIEDVHRDFRGRSRGGDNEAEALALLNAEQAKATAAEKPTQKNLHKAGLALLIALQHEDAVDALERALAMGESVELLNDTAAAHVERMSSGDLKRAIELSDRSLRLEHTTAALWNRALALEYLGQDQEAVAAFNDYIAAERDPAWDEEARNHIARITPQR